MLKSSLVIVIFTGLLVLVILRVPVKTIFWKIETLVKMIANGIVIQEKQLTKLYILKLVDVPSFFAVLANN